ncbi:hypothetical protein [Antrihabitans stalactiti]|uniref:Uncharacterized protein n=1 Tax=Antrihabitans stalactiti TaxID=2584121 RepID=A0A848KLE1_9NOCA|nr:hypothetical protein [Antrihabitans stalactiti]NMN99485.1 hypothetical protein [Antrihabitans stalactiti]
MTTQYYDTAETTARLLSRIVKTSGVEPTERVAATLAELATITADERRMLAEIAGDESEMQDLTEVVADRYVAGETNADELLQQLALKARITGKERRRASNQITFRTSRAAGLALRKLGDGMITDIFGPWCESRVREAEDGAPLVVEGGQMLVWTAHNWERELSGHWRDHVEKFEKAGVLDSRTKGLAAVIRLRELKEDLDKTWMQVQDLRARGYLTASDDPTFDARRYFWAHPGKLPDAANEHVREAAWMAEAIVNGAGPCIRTAHEAIARQPVS